ncbi:hypothetical protein [Paraliomyxa miuraensis]|uniref:hypothetical protein n=1 Tax=Paraliomyxa miuraensis TaxID=376150 RepID=UPI00225C40CD|nr:hypothetical protein [Paraliomyxa miuraensis]MCX4242930.1 hypothetical protein [Paraliomyxa miuraensis]
MPTITNLELSIDKGTGGQRRKVTVRYRINFNSSERLAGTVFRERVSLRGDDALSDDDLTTIYNNNVKAPVDPTFIERTIVRMVSRDRIDEDSDFVLADRDEIYARVRLEPFSPGSVQGDSNLVYGQFGGMGSD